MEQVHG